jgi:hypothetical protein
MLSEGEGGLPGGVISSSVGDPSDSDMRCFFDLGVDVLKINTVNDTLSTRNGCDAPARARLGKGRLSFRRFQLGDITGSHLPLERHFQPLNLSRRVIQSRSRDKVYDLWMDVRKVRCN